MMSTCDMCGKELFMDLPAQGVFTFKFATIERMHSCNYRVTPDPENYPICDWCWPKTDALAGGTAWQGGEAPAVQKKIGASCCAMATKKRPGRPPVPIDRHPQRFEIACIWAFLGFGVGPFDAAKRAL